MHFAHSWPRELGPDEVARLDTSLLLGLVEGIAREEWPPMESAITCVTVGHRSTETTPAAVRIAATMAIKDMCRQPGWETTESGSSPPDVA